MTKLLFLSGSVRKESFNKKLAKKAAAIAKELGGAEVTFIDLKDFPMPIYDGDLEDESGLPDNAKKLKKLFIECDGFFIASPEYNSSIPPLLKNSLDWISRKSEANEGSLIAFTGKVAAICSASPGALGGLRGLVPLRLMLGNINVLVIPDQLAVGNAATAFNDNGDFADEKHKNSLTNVVKKFIKVSASL